MIYLDNAATTLHKPEQVIEAVAEAMRSMGNSSRGTHSGSLAASRTIYATREKLARFFGCPRADHVVFTCNSTEALNIAISGTIGAGDHVITTDLEHNSVLRPLYRLQDEKGTAVSFVPADRQGRIDYADFERLLRPETRAIICTHASNLTGNLVDIARVGAIARAHGLLFIVDASQTAGVFPIDMEAMGIDILCFTGHKGLMGPQGIGALLVAPGVELRPGRVGGTGVQSALKTQPREYPTRMEAGTLNGPGIAGLGAALEWLEEQNVDALRRREQELTRRFYEGVRELPGVTCYGDFSSWERCPIVSLNLGEQDSARVSDQLCQRFGIATRSGIHCAPLAHRALGTEKQGAVRFSFSHFNTEEEIDQGIQALRTLAAE